MKKTSILIFLILLLAGCNQRDTNLENSISSIVEDSNKSEINVNTLTDIEWDKAFLFTPYSTTKGIEEQLGIKYKLKVRLILEMTFIC